MNVACLQPPANAGEFPLQLTILNTQYSILLLLTDEEFKKTDTDKITMSIKSFLYYGPDFRLQEEAEEWMIEYIRESVDLLAVKVLKVWARLFALFDDERLRRWKLGTLANMVRLSEVLPCKEHSEYTKVILDKAQRLTNYQSRLPPLIKSFFTKNETDTGFLVRLLYLSQGSLPLDSLLLVCKYGKNQLIVEDALVECMKINTEHLGAIKSFTSATKLGHRLESIKQQKPKQDPPESMTVLDDKSFLEDVKEMMLYSDIESEDEDDAPTRSKTEAQVR